MSTPADVNDESSQSPSGTTSFVYPVRSLLSGLRRRSHEGVSKAECSRGTEHGEGTPENEVQCTESLAGVFQQLCDMALPVNIIFPDKLGEVTLNDPSGSCLPGTDSAASTSKPKRKKHRAPNFRDFADDEDPLQLRTFATNPTISVMSHEHDDAGVNTLFVEGPTGEPVEYTPPDPDPADDEGVSYNRRHPPQLSDVAADAFADVTTPSTLDPTLSQGSYEPPSNFSQSGIVHLGPASSRSHSAGSNRGRSSRNSGHSSDTANKDMMMKGRPDSMSGSEAASGAGSGSMAGSGTTSSSEGPRITFRYQHMEDDEGHHLIVGREGKLTRCEDEVCVFLIPWALVTEHVLPAYSNSWGSAGIRSVDCT